VTSYYGSIYPSVRNLLLAAQAAGLGAALITLPLLRSAGRDVALQVGDKAPDFWLPATTAEAVSLTGYLRKKAIELYFFTAAFGET
jgi:hypothetical protein